MLLKNPGVDLAYTRGWLRDFSATLSEPFLDRFNEVLRGVGLDSSPEHR